MPPAERYSRWVVKMIWGMNWEKSVTAWKILGQIVALLQHPSPEPVVWGHDGVGGGQYFKTSS